MLIYSSHTCNTRLASTEPGCLECLWTTSQLPLSCALARGMCFVCSAELQASRAGVTVPPAACCCLGAMLSSDGNTREGAGNKQDKTYRLDAVSQSSTGCLPGAEFRTNGLSPEPPLELRPGTLFVRGLTCVPNCKHVNSPIRGVWRLVLCLKFKSQSVFRGFLPKGGVNIDRQKLVNTHQLLLLSSIFFKIATIFYLIFCWKLQELKIQFFF